VTITSDPTNPAKENPHMEQTQPTLEINISPGRYSREQVADLINEISKHMKAGAHIVVGNPYRPAAEKVLDLITKMINSGHPSHVMIGGHQLGDIRSMEDCSKSYDEVVDDIANCIKDAMRDEGFGLQRLPKVEDDEPQA
jgi:hypothetical protein